VDVCSCSIYVKLFFSGAQQRNHQQLWNLRPTYVSLIFFVFVYIGNKHAPAIDMFNRIIIYQEIQFSTELCLFQIDPTACESKFGECSVGDLAIWLFVMHQALGITPTTQSSTEFHIAWWVLLGWRSPQNTTLVTWTNWGWWLWPLGLPQHGG